MLKNKEESYEYNEVRENAKATFFWRVSIILLFLGKKNPKKQKNWDCQSFGNIVVLLPDYSYACLLSSDDSSINR